MKTIRTQNVFTLVVRFAGWMVLAVGLSASALASCGDSLSAMAAAAALHGHFVDVRSLDAVGATA